MKKNVEVLEATTAFFLADKRYMMPVRTFLHSEDGVGELMTMQTLAQINAARKIRGELEARMYQVWAQHGYRRADGHEHLHARSDRRGSTSPEKSK